MRPIASVVASVALLVGACGAAPEGQPATPDPVEAGPAPVATTAAPPTGTSSGEGPADAAGLVAEGAPREVVDFVAALDEALADTRYVGAPLADPAVFVATGRLFCEELSGGAGADALLVRYVEVLTGGSIDAADEDDLVLAGSILGVAGTTLCPEHERTIVASD